jgi:serine/threonine-protein kinase
MTPTDSNPTADYHTIPDGRSSNSPNDGRLPATNRPPVALVFGSAPTTPDVTDLLRSRLRFAALLFTVYYSISLAIQLWSFEGRSGIAAWEWGGLASLVGVVVVSAAVAWVCWSGRRWTLRQWRVAEAVLFGVVFARNLHRAALFSQYYGAWRQADAALASGRPGDAAELYVTLSSEFFASWLVLVLTYGVLIPNTGRRSAIVVGAITFTALACWLAMGPAAGVPMAFWLRIFVLSSAVVLLAVAAVAVFASHRLDRARHESEDRRVGQYRLRRKLGAGGMGEVHLAEHMLLRRPCAVKVIRPDRVGDPQTLARFEREVQITATLTHPNTVQVYDYGRTEDGTFYYAMEYLPGWNLDELIAAAGPLPAGRVVHMLRQVCGALAEAHAAGLVHRDIKPSNVIACERGGVFDVAKLLDFGLVRFDRPRFGRGELTAEGSIAGTPAYLSPEQAAGDVKLDARSDIYSLGALAYFLLTGEPPFAGRSSVRMIAAHLHEPPTPLTEKRPTVPVDVSAVVMRCLAKQPAERFADVRSVEQALSGCACAGEWTAEDASRWWKAHPLPPTLASDASETRSAG